eukprot:7199216-Lingulodinium_polyedra.AAC.1
MAKARTQNITRRSRQDLIDWLKDCSSLTDAEFRGLSSHIAQKESPACSKISHRLVLAWMRCLKRLGFDKKEDQSWRLALDDVHDECLVASWTSLKKDLHAMSICTQ